jgi:hypothetical protein
VSDAGALEIVVHTSDKTNFDALKSEAKQSGKQAGDKLGEGLEKGGESGGKKAGSALGKHIGKAAAAAGAAAGTLLAKGFADNMEIGAANSKLKAQLDLSKEDAAKAGDVAGKVYRDNWGENIGEVNDAIRSVSVNLGAVADTSQADLQKMTESALALSDAFGVDVAESTVAASKLIKNGLAKDATAAFDLITAGFTSGLDVNGDWLDTLNEYSIQFSKLGITGDDALGILSRGMQAGARDTDSIADAFKEFSLRAIDGSKLTADGFKAIGIDAKKASKVIAEGGPVAESMTQDVLDGLARMKDPVAQNAAGVALFGTQWEDTLRQILPAMDDIHGGFADVEGATDRMSAALGDNGKAKIESAKRAFEGWTQSMASSKGPLGDVASGALAFGAPALAMAGSIGALVSGLAAMNLGMVVAKVGMVTSAVATGAWTAAQWALNVALTANPIGLVVVAVAALIGGLLYAYHHSSRFRAIVQAAGRGAVAAFRAAAGAVASAGRKIVAAYNAVIKGANKAGEGIRDAFAGAYHAIVDPIWNAIQWATGALNSLGEKIRNVVGSIPGFAAGGIVGQAASGGVRSGLTWVGEHGPELVKLPTGSRVHSAGDSARMATSGGGDGQRVVLEIRSGGSKFDDALVEILQKAVRTRGGGNVQLALGR